MTEVLRRLWSALREVSGDDAYDRYLTHRAACAEHAADPPLDRASFFKEEQRRKWDGIRRCC